MCGILLHYLGDRKDITLADDELIEFEEDFEGIKSCSNIDPIFNSMISDIAARGPNYSSFKVSKQYSITWFSSVLSLREPFTKQCVEIKDRYVVQFNGELYNDEIQYNDTQYTIQLLKEGKEIIDVIRKLDGEFAYTIYDIQNRMFYFGRDPIGRRCLSFSIDNETGELYISSVTGCKTGFQDCIAGTIYKYDCQLKELNTDSKISKPFYVSEELDDENLSHLDDNVEKLYTHLLDSVSKRVVSIHPAHIQNSPISVLFSGGLDCSVIVALICEHFKQSIRHKNLSKTIELLNVGFENPRTGTMPKDVPDRKLAISSYKTLQRLYPEIDIKLIQIDVSYEEYLKHRPKVIDLMYPKQTEMDLSIAISFFFASMGNGYLYNEEKTNDEIMPYERKGIVLFSGLGADELYGGYHKFANKSTEELVKELTKQINNIYDRNLNRDDKVIAHNGVEVRYPFLDIDVIKFSTEELPINYKINKLILRKLAMNKLHLANICDEPKRAIQFGSKSAKMTKDGNKHGTDLLK
ncbi:putative asparagine synthase NDAI_0K00180 [Naumovozyma dairenensis CBS 421]|uniref:Asparagine synthase (glutamine-hydrolyzing) n=1 Tax=Naumovozyma dairenensis (strain ATCC 10597 / BCRC 20456 / CBS 421 / NBRC 0211 / NRRL Y-12639) TaxID=1071378 RepID=G0WHE6_NAUDC|nr:hypothetical protein NDAI_0K00180 [Naumovozyma dairenensis CBS 421]CCD27207.1 hypothetical protein NDAI_0K00180 [Naumovozyma dairenensis CBS 421]